MQRGPLHGKTFLFSALVSQRAGLVCAGACRLSMGVAGFCANPSRSTGTRPLSRGDHRSLRHCHTLQKLQEARQVDLPGMHLAGGYGFDNPVLGRWVGANITSDPETGIGRWTEVQIATAIREGKRPDGSIIGPPMPFAHLRKVSDADVSAMAAYLKSVPPVRHVVERPSYRITLPANWGPPVSGQAGPPDGDPVLRGAYLAEVGHCMDCHTPNRPGGGGRDWSRTGAGGRPTTGLAGRVPAHGVSPQPGRAEMRGTQRATADSRVGTVSLSVCSPSSCM